MFISSGPKIDFMKMGRTRVHCFLVLVVIGNAYGLYRGQRRAGVEFSGGNTITMNFAQRIDVDKLRDAATRAQVGDVLIAYQRDISTQRENLRVTTRLQQGRARMPMWYSADKLIAQLRQAFPEAQFSVASVDRVGPTVGAEIRNAAICPLLLALVRNSRYTWHSATNFRSPWGRRWPFSTISL
jgi:SecD/SecF fusion protein